LHALGVVDAAPEDIFDDLANLALEVSGSSGVEITFADGRQQVRKAASGKVPAAGARSAAEHRIPITLRSGLTVGQLVIYGRPSAGLRLTMLERVARQAGAVLDQRLAANWHEGGSHTIGITVLDANGCLLSASPDLEHLFGWTLDECIGTNMIDLIHPDDLEEAVIAFERTGHIPGLKAPYDIRLRKKDGTWISVELTADNRLDDPSVRGIVYTVREQRARPHGDHMLAREAATLQRIALGDPLPAVTEAIAGILDELVEGGMGCVLVVDRLLRHWSNPVLGRQEEPEHDDTPAVLHPVGWGSLPPEVVRALEGVPVGLDAPPPGRCVFQGQSSMTVDLTTDASWGTRRRVLEAHGLASCWALPIIDSSQDVALGAIVVFRNIRGRPNFGESQIMDLCASLTVTAINREVTESELITRASRDPLTNLPNRAQFLSRLEQMLQSTGDAHGPSVIFLDLDRFKIINDSLGHEAGDRLLRSAAERLSEALPPPALVARFGGDEFACIVPDDSAIDALRRAQKLLTIFDEPLQAGDREIFLNASAGVVCAGPDDTSPGSLLQHADAALYRAKELGRGQAALFDDDMKARALDRLAVEHGLRTALREHELVVYFQPQFTIKGHKIAGVEALVRWRHPQWGMTAPGRFIHVAEETGVIGPVTEVVLAASCALARSLAMEVEHRSVPVWVNLSASQLSHPSLVDWISNVLLEHGVVGDQLGIEITEGAVMEDADDCVRNLHRMRDLGLHLGIDDFGTGYSSLSYLRRLPVDLLKLDQSFLAALGTDPEHDAIVKTVFDLAHTLGMASLAEGVETTDQVERLAELGCELLQGYLFARPAPADEILTLLAGATAGRGAARGASHL
jgi:diguanylate cyclase (GGDEF)-like protein/PAS domain S-box-containing protein